MSDDGVVVLSLIRHVRQTTSCTVCGFAFRDPRLLSACFHTFCLQCIQPLVTGSDAADGSERNVLTCPQCSEESTVSPSDGEDIPAKDYFANKLLETTGHLLNLSRHDAREFVKKIHDACECPVCCQLCRQPHILPCGHTFCIKCLEACTENDRQLSTVSKCPLCRRSYFLPAEGCSGLPTNRLLSRILDKLSEPEVHELVSGLVDPDSMDRGSREVVGIAELLGRLYVLNSPSRSIHVRLAEKPYSFITEIPLDGVIEPTDLAASLFDKCLYVSDVGEAGCVWQVRMEEQVVEHSPEVLHLNLDRNAIKFERIAENYAELSTDSSKSTHGRDRLEIEQLNQNDSSAATADVSHGPCVAEGSFVKSFVAKDEKCHRGRTYRMAELEGVDLQQRGQAGIDILQLIRILHERQSAASSVSEATQENALPQPMLSAPGANMVTSEGDLLERTGMMKKIAESRGKGPRVFAISHHYSTKRWVEGVRAYAMSVGSDGQLIVVTDNGHLVIYGVDGQVIVDHCLPEDVQKPHYALFSPTSGTFIVSHSSVDGSVHRVCELILDPVTSRLHVARSYGGTVGKQQEYLNWPRHLAITDEGWVIVADCGSDQVLVLDDKLRLRRVILEDIRRPWRLCFMPRTGLLAVGYITGKIDVFSVLAQPKRKK